jgi:hypothetical protein
MLAPPLCLNWLLRRLFSQKFDGGNVMMTLWVEQSVRKGTGSKYVMERPV